MNLKTPTDSQKFNQRLGSVMLLCLCLNLLPVGRAVSAHNSVERGVSLQTANKSIPVRGLVPVTFDNLNSREYCISQQKIHVSPFNIYLISIDHKNLKNLSAKQIDALTWGEVGSSMQLTYIQHDGKVKTINLVRQAVAEKRLNQCNEINTYDRDNRSCDLNQGFVEKSLDIEARATQNLILREAGEWPDDTSESLASAAICAALTNYEIGNIASGDRFLELFEHRHQRGKKIRLLQNRLVVDAVKTLISVGKIDDARLLLTLLAEGKGMSVVDEIGSFRTLAQAEAKIDVAKALDVISSYGDFLKYTRGGNGESNESWVAQIYMQAGAFQKAQKIYEWQIAGQQPKHNDEIDWQSAQSLALKFYKLAQMQYLSGDKAGALLSLQQATEKLTDSIPAEVRDVLSDAPGVFPTLADLTAAKDAVANGKDFPSENLHIDISEDSFPDVRSCHNAIAEGDKRLSSKLAHSFLEKYKSEPLPSEHSPGRQNLYCSILSLAREMSDRGWFDLSDEIIKSLKQHAHGNDASAVAKIFLEAELTYNASQKHKSADTAWRQFDEIYEKESPTPKTSQGQKLRQMAIPFYYAGELKRAETFINRSLSVEHSNMGVLDAACIAARQNKWQEAENYWKQLRAFKPSKYSGFRHTVLELCSLYWQNNKKVQTMSMLQEVLTKPIGPSDVQLKQSEVDLELYLAQLLLESKRFSEAHKIASSAARKLSVQLSWPQCVVVAQCAEAAGDFSEATKYYSMRPNRMLPNYFQTNSECELGYMQKALEMSIKVPGYDRQALAKLYAAVAERLERRNPDKACDLYQRASNLIASADPQKSIFLMKGANVLDPIGALAPPDEWTVVLTEEKQAQNLKKAISLRTEGAKLAEANGEPHAREQWADVASTELRAGLTSQTIEHLRHVMALYTSQSAKKHEGVLGSPPRAIVELSYSTHAEEAEKLLIEAASKATAVAGPSSVAAQAQLVELFEYYLRQKKYDQALNTLDKVLTFDMSTGESLSQRRNIDVCYITAPWSQPVDAVSIVVQIFSIVEPIQKELPELAKTIYERVLKSQRLWLSPQDERLVPALAKLGDVNFQLQKYGDADIYYSDAYAITCQFHKGEFAVRQTGEHYIENCKKLGHMAQAEALSNRVYEGVQK
ncbi:MAG: hypothetical protein P4L53_20735 [Candidatus Obscuribacterales bacterium]|nr:hypothetical protein [Candidatus Obscuribacterales bacterium]